MDFQELRCELLSQDGIALNFIVFVKVLLKIKKRAGNGGAQMAVANGRQGETAFYEQFVRAFANDECIVGERWPEVAEEYARSQVRLRGFSGPVRETIVAILRLVGGELMACYGG